MDNRREHLNVDLYTLLQKLPEIGRLMVNSKNMTVTSERTSIMRDTCYSRIDMLGTGGEAAV